MAKATQATASTVATSADDNWDDEDDVISTPTGGGDGNVDDAAFAEIDLSAVPDAPKRGDFPVLEPGKYVLMVEKSENGTTSANTGSKPKKRLTLRVVRKASGEEIDGIFRVWEDLPFTENALPYTKPKMAVLGYTGKVPLDFNESVIGAQFVAALKIDTYIDKTGKTKRKNVIRGDFEPVPEGQSGLDDLID